MSTTSPSSLPTVWLSLSIPSATRPAQSHNSFQFNLFANPHPLNPAASILYRNMGGRAWTQLAFPRPDLGRCDVFSTYPFCLQYLAHSFVLTKITTFFFSIISTLFSKNTRGVGGTSFNG